MSETAPAKLRALRELPSVDQLLKTEAAKRLQDFTGADTVNSDRPGSN